MNSEKDKQEEFPGNLSKTIKFALKLKDNKAVRNMEELREYFDINEIMESFLDGKLIEWLSDRSYVDRKAATNGELSRSEKVKNLKIEFDKVKKAAKETGYEGQLEAKARDVAKKLCDILEKKRDEAVDQSIKDLNISTVENLMNKEDYLLNYLSEVFVKKNIDKLAHNQQELNRLIKNGVKNISLFVPMSDNAETYIIMKHAMKKGRRFIGVGNKKANIRIVGEDGSYMDDEQIENLLSENKITLDNIIYKIDDNKESVEDEVNQSRNAELQQGVSAYDESSRKKVHDKLIRYMDACFPLIYLTTFEEEKVDDIIKSVADGREIIEWNAQGYFIYKKENVSLGHWKGGWSLADTLGRFINDVLFKEKDITLNNVILVLKDAQKLLEDWRVVAQLKYLSLLIYKGELVNCNIIIVSPVLEIPKELESYLTVLEMAHLTEEEIKELVEKFCKAQRVPFPYEFIEELSTALKGLSEFDIVNILSYAISDDRELTREDIKSIMKHKRRMIRKANVLEMVKYEEKDIELGGMGELQEWLKRKSYIFKHSDDAKRFGVTTPKGMLIAGMPGCGKSLCAKVTAVKFGMPLLRLDMGRIMGKYVGESEENMRRALEMSKAIAPCVLWIDEIEKAFSGMGSEGGGADITTRLSGSFLTWLQEKEEAVFVVATANDITKLPPELLRKGRFDEIFFVDLPNKEERKEIFKIHIKKRKKKWGDKEWGAFEKYVDEIVYATEGYSGADIEGVVSEAVEIAFCNPNNKALTKDVLLETIKSTVPLSQINKTAIGSMLKLYQQNNFRKASGVPKQSLWKILMDKLTRLCGILKGGYKSCRKNLKRN